MPTVGENTHSWRDSPVGGKDFLKYFPKRFASSKKVCTFAVPFDEGNFKEGI
jgi:hypothetical protein